MENEKKTQNTQFKVTINCKDCGVERHTTKACLNLVKRCKSCQKIFNRNRARNRYRELKGIPIDKPVIERKKKIEEKKRKKIKKHTELVATKLKTKVSKEPIISEEEMKRRQAVMEKLFDLIEDESTVDDW